MPRVVRTPQANEDVLTIWEYIADDNVEAADRLLRKIGDLFQYLAENPFMGHEHEEYHPGLRSFPLGNYSIFYHPIKDGIEVYRVLHGARQLEDLL